MMLPNNDNYDDDYFADDDESSNRPGVLTIIISLLVLIAMLASLVAPLLYNRYRNHPPPTPTPNILLEAYGLDSAQPNKGI